ncbi:flippase [Balneola sp. MJW-20]|uniref:flippase n=1 Tax=Gracilimonas aurantiaca TaxID=3234185 RepID=UPI003465BAB5
MSINDSENIKRSITRNTSVMLAAQAVTWAASFVMLLFLPRLLGSDDFGKLFLAMSIAMMIDVLIDFGGAYLIPKEVSRSKSRTANILSNFAGVRLVIWLVSMIGIIAFSFLAGYDSVTRLIIVILCFARSWSGIRMVLTSGFQGHEKMEYPSLGGIAQKVFVSTLVVSALLLGYGPITVAVIMALGILVNLLVHLKFSSRIVEGFTKVEWRSTKSMLTVSVPYFLWSLFSIIYYRVDAVMLSLMTDDTVVGWYGASYKFFDIVMALPSIFTTVVFPIFARLWIEEKNQMYLTFQKSLKFMVILSLPVAIGIFGYSSDIVTLFFGLEEYTPSILVLQIFAISIPLVYVDFIFGSTILAADKQKKWSVVGFFAIFVNIILNYLLIPYFQASYGNGGLGAASATFATELFILGCAYALIPADHKKAISLRFVPYVLFAAAFMGLVMWIGSYLGLHWIISGVLALISYALGTLYLGALDEKEQEFILGYITLSSFRGYLRKKKESTL